MIGDIHKATGHAVRRICDLLGAPRSSYCSAATPSPSRVRDEEIAEIVTEIFNHHRSRYGSRRIHAGLADRDVTCALDRVRRIMAERGLRALQPKSFMGTLKNEMLRGGTFADEADARIEIFDFIESYYNNHRKHCSLGYQTPAQFEASHLNKN